MRQKIRKAMLTDIPNEASYKKWFDDNFPEYDSIYQKQLD